MQTTTRLSGSTKRLSAPHIMRLYLTIAVPCLLVLVSIRVVMTPAFLTFEYTRPGFPADYYGFTTEDRLNYAPYALNYLLNNEDISYLGNLRFENDQPLYNARELGHMRDVKVVTQFAFGIAVAGGLAALLSAYALWKRPASRPMLRRALLDGSLITLSLITAIVVLAIAAWDVFFTGFHNLFFAEGTWQFLYSDTLIRLFPEQFWFDAALVIGGLTTVGAIILLILSWRWRPVRGESLRDDL